MISVTTLILEQIFIFFLFLPFFILLCTFFFVLFYLYLKWYEPHISPQCEGNAWHQDRASPQIWGRSLSLVNGKRISFWPKKWVTMDNIFIKDRERWPNFISNLDCLFSKSLILRQISWVLFTAYLFSLFSFSLLLLFFCIMIVWSETKQLSKRQ